MSPWLHIIGIGEDGFEGLSSPAQEALRSADVIIGGDRHHGLAPDLKAERIHWPSPFRTLVDEIGKMSDRTVAVMVTGDPLWFSAGAYLVKAFAGDCKIYPNLSAFQFAAARMGWSLADIETLTIHGRPAEQIIPYFAPGKKILTLTQDATSPATVAKLLTDRGFGESKLTVLGALGGPNETREEGVASTWSAQSPDFHVLALECIAGGTQKALPLTGLPDDAFEHDGQITKREIRALTISALSPRRGDILWDIGAGSGSIGIEFMRAGRDAMAYGIEAKQSRAEAAKRNAIKLGAPRLRVEVAQAPAGLDDLPSPDAIFIGGGLTAETVEICLKALKPNGRLVANAVTLESEAFLAELEVKHGGTLSRISIQRSDPVGRLRGWRPLMPVTQWTYQK